MSPAAEKAMFASFIMVSAVLAAAIAHVVRLMKMNLLLGCLNIFGAGVLLAAGFVHLLNDAEMSFANVTSGASAEPVNRTDWMDSKS